MLAIEIAVVAVVEGVRVGAVAVVIGSLSWKSSSSRATTRLSSPERARARSQSALHRVPIGRPALPPLTQRRRRAPILQEGRGVHEDALAATQW